MGKELDNIRQYLREIPTVEEYNGVVEQLLLMLTALHDSEAMRQRLEDQVAALTAEMESKVKHRVRKLK